MMNDAEKRCPAIARLRRGSVAASEIKAISPGCRAWIGVYPLHPFPELKHKGDYRIRVFEVEEKYLVDDDDVWDGVMKNRLNEYVFTEKVLLETIERFIDPSQLSTPFKCDYPV